MLVNLGGIANFTYLRAGCVLDDVLGWDVGPGNMILDALARHLLQRDVDHDGAEASRGRADTSWVQELLAEEFFTRPAPKSAGREEFGAAYVQRFLRDGTARGLGAADLLATAVELTACSVALAPSQEPLAGQPLQAVYVCGGGRRNATLMGRLRDLLAPARVDGIEALGFDAEAKEAMDFAVLANESLLGHAGNVARITGARRPCILGSLALASFQGAEEP
jgi:anhydro-N-acetylmuramic acid kinase